MTEKLQSILEAEGLSALLSKFNEQGVTDSILGGLTDSDLKELGVGKLGERKRLLSAFARPGSQQPAQHHTIVESTPVSASRQEDFTYEAANGEITITGFSGKGHVVIPDKFDDLPLPVRVIGHAAFKENGAIISVKIPRGVTSIESEAFCFCTSLTRAELPDTVTDIGGAAFAGCSNLSDIDVPSGVVNIARMAFSSVGLRHVTIPKSVASIDPESFERFTTFDVDPKSSTYKSKDGVLFDKEMTTLVLYPSCKDGVYSIPPGVSAIGYGAFQKCDGLTGVVIPDGVVSIGDYAFFSCDKLTSVIFPKSLRSIGRQAFHVSGLTSVSIPSSVTHIGDYAFCGCPLTNVDIPASVTCVGVGAFHGCDQQGAVSTAQKPFLTRLFGG